jgi:ATP-dependent Lon protease
MKSKSFKKSQQTKELSKKKQENSDDDNIYSEHSENSEEEEIDVHEYRKYLSKIFPSKYLDKKIKAGEELKKHNAIDEEYDSDNYTEKQPTHKKYKNNSRTKSKQISSKQKSSSKQKEDKQKENNNDKSDEENYWEDIDEDEDEDDKDNNNDDDYQESKKSKSKKSKSKKSKKSKQEYSDYDYDEEDSEYEEEYDDDCLDKKTGKYNIIFAIGDYNDDEYDSDYDENDDDKTENEDEEVSTDEDEDEDEEHDDDEYEDKDSYSSEESVFKPKTRSQRNKSNNKSNSKKSSKKEETEQQKNAKINNLIDNDNKENKKEVLEQLKDLIIKNPKDKTLKKIIETYEFDIQKEEEKKAKKEKKQKAKNMRIFKKILRDKNTLNDFTFYEKLDTPQQVKLIKELREINKITRIEKPYRITLLESAIPIRFKAAAMKKINSLKYMEPGTGEFYKIKNWVDTFMKIPFTEYKELPITVEKDGVDKCHEFMENAQKTLNDAVYGLNDAKMQIMQMLGQLLTNPKAIGTAIAIHGPPGSGKTTLVKEGISKILDRPFAFIALGGATDSSFLEGHGYTYEGSTWGKIVQILIESKCMNPVIYFDELDKISDTPKGEEIAGILTHLTDTSQNSQFHDKYFSEIEFDLSKCLFIFSYNDESRVNPILKDRMYKIQTQGYSFKEKITIANHYLLPKIREQVKFNSTDVIIDDDVISYINEYFCSKEDGVRNMKRCLEIIYTKLNLYRLMKPGTNLFKTEMSIKVSFPFNVTKDIVDKLVKIKTQTLPQNNMYI